MFRKSLFIFVILFLSVVPRVLNYQGKILDSGGAGINGRLNMTFRLYTTELGGSPIWEEEIESVLVSLGLFSVLLGTRRPFPDSVDFSVQYWLEVEINGETMNPRERLTSVPYAIRSQHATLSIYDVSSSANRTRRTGHIFFAADESTATITDTGDTITIFFTGLAGGGIAPQSLSQVLAVGNSAGGFNINMNFNRVINLGEPIEDNDAVTKNYVNNLDGEALSFYSEKFNVNVDGKSLYIIDDTIGVKPEGITSEHIAPYTIQSDDIDTAGIQSFNIASGAVGTEQIALSAVTTDRIAPGAITGDRIAAGTITSEQIAEGSIQTDRIAPNAITSDRIADGSVTGDDLYWADVTPRLGDSLFFGGGITLKYAASESISALDAVYLSRWLSGWGYRTPFTITNIGAALSQYQVKIEIGSAFPWSHCQNDGRDIRVVDSDGSVPLPFWFQSWNYGTSAVIWVKIDNIQALSSKTIYIYYGNSSATSAQSFDNTFTKNFGDGGLVVLYHMDEGAGTTLPDSSGRFNHGTINGALWQTADGGQWDGRSDANFSSGSNLLFDGVDDYVSVPDATSLDIQDAITIEAWVNGTGSVAADWWNSAWLYRRRITLSQATPVSNYQVKVLLTPSNFDYSHVRSDGGDLRFADTTGNSLSYWLEQWNEGGNSVLWVRVATAGTSSFFIYYGNPAASSSSDPSVIKGTSANPGISCTDIRNSRSQLENGLYYIDPNGPPITDAYQVYCDMATANGGWTLVMKLSKNDFCYGSSRWTDSSPFNESYTLTPTMPNAQQYDAKHRAFYELTDVNALRFYTSRDTSVTVTFASASSPRTLMTTNTIAFSPYPDYFQWKAAFGHDRSQAPIFMRAGVAVYGGPNCRTNSCPVGCGKPCMFCYQASDGAYCCPCAATLNDVNSGVGNNPDYCGGGDPNDCSAAGNWSDPSLRVIIWARGTITNPINIVATVEDEQIVGGTILAKGLAYKIGIANLTLIGAINNKVITSTLNSGWNHIALTYNGTTMKLYINGAQANSQSLSGAITTNSNNLIIGEKFTGRIDEVRIYDRALSAAEIRCHYERRRYAESEPTSTMGSEETSSAIGLQKASATSTYHAEQFLGIALTSGAPGDSIPVRIFGVAQGFSGLTVGADYYLQNAPGRIGTNPGNINKRVGTAIADDKLFISR